MRPTRTQLVAATGVVATLVALSVSDTSALFTDSDPVGANLFTNSTINLTLNPATALVTASSMLPGDSVTGAILVSNGAGSSAQFVMKRWP